MIRKHTAVESQQHASVTGISEVVRTLSPHCTARRQHNHVRWPHRRDPPRGLRCAREMGGAKSCASEWVVQANDFREVSIDLHIWQTSHPDRSPTRTALVCRSVHCAGELVSHVVRIMQRCACLPTRTVQNRSCCATSAIPAARLRSERRICPVSTLTEPRLVLHDLRPGRSLKHCEISPLSGGSEVSREILYATEAVYGMRHQ